MNKKMIMTVAMAVLAVGAFAAPPRGGGHRGPHRGGAHIAPRHHHHHGGWGKGGRNFWPGFVGGVVGGIVGRTVVTTPAVVTTPTVVTTPAVVTTPTVVVNTTPVTTVQNVWVEGRYVDQIQSNGTVVRVWQPGHYEQRTVVVP